MTTSAASIDVLPTARERDQVLSRIGAGGMAEVFLIRRTGPGGFEKFLALKRVRADLDHDTYGPMFMQEAKLVAALHHPNIVQVHDAGADDSGHWFLMEYVHGKSVNAIIRRALERGVEIPIECAMYLIACVGRALHYAHHAESATSERLAVIHRDVSPGNVLVSFDGIVKLADFGIARGNHRRSETQDGTFKGKFGYAAPEHCRGEPLDSASDIFSLGIVLHETIAARNLFRGESPSQIVHAVMASPIPSLCTLRREVPAELDALVARMLDRDRATRIASGAEVANQLDAIAHQHGLEATREKLALLMRSLFSTQEMRLPTSDGGESSEPRTPSALGTGSRRPAPAARGASPSGAHLAETARLDEASAASVTRASSAAMEVAQVAPEVAAEPARKRSPAVVIGVTGIVAAAAVVIAYLALGRGAAVPTPAALSTTRAAEPATAATPAAPPSPAPEVRAPAPASAAAPPAPAAEPPAPAAEPSQAPATADRTVAPSAEPRPSAAKPASKRKAPKKKPRTDPDSLLERDW